jgi:hypothetical protein
MNTETPGSLLAAFYAGNNLEADGGQGSSRVKIEVSKSFHFYFPNFDARRKAVILHDIHHIVTGYSASSLAGESEISAWEIGSGCKSHWAAFFINTSGFMIGIPFNFMGVLKAFARGRRTGNLYSNSYTVEKAMAMPVIELQKELLLDKFPIDTKPSLSDLFLFLMFVLYGAVFSIITLALLPVIILYTIYCWIVPER